MAFSDNTHGEDECLQLLLQQVVSSRHAFIQVALLSWKCKYLPLFVDINASGNVLKYQVASR